MTVAAAARRVRRPPVAAALLLALLLAACAGQTPGTGEDGAAAGAVAEVLDGYLVYREPLILPPEALADVRLVRLDAEGTPDHLVAAAEMPGPLLPVTPFRLLYDPSYVAAVGGRLGVAAVISVRHHTLFSTERPVPVTLPRSPAADALVVPLYGQWDTVSIGG